MEKETIKTLLWPREIRIGQSLSIAILSVEKAEEVFALIDENREYLARWLPWVDETCCVDDTRRHIMKAPVQLQQGTDVNYVIKFNHTIVGRVGFHYFEPFSSVGRLGYWLSENSQGRGIMSRVCNHLTEEALCRQGIRRVEIRCAVEKIAKVGEFLNGLAIVSMGFIRRPNGCKGNTLTMPYTLRNGIGGLPPVRTTLSCDP